MVRWIMTLAQYRFDVEFISGIKNSFANLLSREFLQANDVNNLRCNAIRRLENEIHIECADGSYSLDPQKSLMDYQTVWFPMKETKYRHRTGQHYFSWDDQLQRNDEAFEALSFLQDMGNLDFTLHKDAEENLVCCEIYIVRFLLPANLQSNESHKRQEKAWYTGMHFENKLTLFSTMCSFPSGFMECK